jgi:4-carboxymuconolactone decarboxylase
MTLVTTRGPHPQSVADREAEILGRPQRVASLALSEVGQDVWGVVNNIRANIGLGQATDLPGYTLLMAKHPEVFRRQMEMGATLFAGRLPARERELAVLRIGWLLQAPYEWGEHVDISQRYGVTKEEIERVTQGSDAPGWSEHEAAILRAIEEMLSRQTVSEETWATLAKTWDEQQLIEFPMVVGQYVCIAIVQNTLRVRLESGNPGLTYR